MKSSSSAERSDAKEGASSLYRHGQDHMLLLRMRRGEHGEGEGVVIPWTGLKGGGENTVICPKKKKVRHGFRRKKKKEGRRRRYPIIRRHKGAKRISSTTPYQRKGDYPRPVFTRRGGEESKG